MLLRNLLQGKLVNGSLGKVVDFITIHEAKVRLIEIANLEAKPQRSLNGDFLPVINGSVDDENTEEKYEGLLALNVHAFGRHERFPLVKFTDGLHLLCAPLAFNCPGSERQLRSATSTSTSRAFLGNVHSQGSGPNHESSKG
ncbi:hypothetical protein EDB19DRAFT_77875 [Suillus lakei]|nr:hypothetical protein EDB19DRAFT_77875 [Suillus lakei]